MIAMVESRTSMPRDRVLFALEMAVEEAVCEYFKTPECLVDIEGRIVNPFFNALSGIETDKTDKSGHWVDGGVNGPEISFDILSKNIIKRCRKLFARNLGLMEKAYLYDKWKPRAHQAVEGNVIDVNARRAVVHLCDNVQGVMLRCEWVPKEIPLYRPGAVFRFYVSKVLEIPSGVTVYLSRGSKSFPAVLLKEKMPWAGIRVLKRIRGEKTWLQTRDRIAPEMIEELRRELNGEIIEILK